MIKLRVESYCHGCSEFDPVLKDETYTAIVFGGAEEKIGDQYVECNLKDVCSKIHDHIVEERFKKVQKC